MKKYLRISTFKKIVVSNKILIIFFAILLLHSFLRLYQLEIRLGLGWDQVRDAWEMKRLIVDGEFPLLGPRTGIGHFLLGPAYYYLLAPFYIFSNLDPIGAGYFAAVVSISTLIALFFVTRVVFSNGVSLISCFLYSVTNYVITADRVPWNVDFIPLVALLIFISLYKILQKNYKWTLLLAALAGFSFHVHFTAVFYPLIILGSLIYIYVVNRDNKIFKWALLAFPLFAIWFLPIYLSETQNSFDNSRKIQEFLDNYYHGFHLRFMLHISKEVLIDYEGFVGTMLFKPLKFLIPIVFVLLVVLRKSKNEIKGLILMIPWFIFPLIGFTLYSGPVSNYYFAFTRPFVVISIAYVLWYLLSNKQIVLRVFALMILSIYTYNNLLAFFHYKQKGLAEHKIEVRDKIQRGEEIQFFEGDISAYLYYIYTRK